jgi:PKD repeat protein
MTTGIMVGCETGQPTNISVYNNFVVGCRVNFETYATVLSNLTVVYNTFVNSTGNASTGYNMGVYIRANTNTYSNCIFKNNIVIEEGAGRVPISVESSHPGLTFSNNCWNRTPTAAALGTGDVIADPKLAKTGSTAAGLLTPAWFKILENSPARDMATVLSNVTEDFFKTPRGSAPDMGGHEFSYGTSSLTASATDSPTAGQAPLTVNFKGSASGGTSPYSYRWTFGDGGSSTSQNPSHTYSSAGTYTATLTVTDSTSATNSKSLTITVTSAPSQLAANVLASPSSGQAPLTVNFTGSATGGVTPYSYRWTFGDGGSTTSQNPSHTYSSAGSYTATLTVTDSTSATNSKSLTITVTSAPSQLTATAYADPTSGLAPLSVNFTGSAAGGAPPYSYNWNFGDGGSSSVQNPSHTYSTIGNYSAILTVTDNNSANASATVIISVGSVTGANLALAAETGSPAPGQGGTTDPSPGNHSYPIGTTVSVKSVPNTDYRFSKWSGDIIDSSMFSSATTLTMDKSKSLSATFCTKCADVNGDLKITPADAQLAFDIYLGRVASPTWCELENADVNCSGTKLTPKVTPSDAQAIFHKFLRRKVASSDCSGSSRAATLSMQSAGFTNVNLTINSVTFAPGQDILIPVIIESPSEIKAFGFDLSFPSSVMTYIGLERTVLTNDYDQLDANVIAYPATNQGENKTEPTEAHLSGFDSILASKIFMPQALDSREPLQDVDQPIVNKTNYRVLRVGGYKTSLSENPSSGVLVTLIFRVTGEVKDPSPLSVMATYDDIQNASIRNGMVNSQDNAQVRQEKRPVGNIERKFSGKRYDF